MHGVNLGTKWLRIQNTLQQSTIHPSLMFTHSHHKQIASLGFVMQVSKIILAFLDYSLVMQMDKNQVLVER